jgi:hypothetical protein
MDGRRTLRELFEHLGPYTAEEGPMRWEDFRSVAATLFRCLLQFDFVVAERRETGVLSLSAEGERAEGAWTSA